MVATIVTHGMVNAANPLLPVLMPASASQPVYVYWAITNAAAATIITIIWGASTLTRGGGTQIPPRQ